MDEPDLNNRPFDNSIDLPEQIEPTNKTELPIPSQEILSCELGDLKIQLGSQFITPAGLLPLAKDLITFLRSGKQVTNGSGGYFG
ncbi:MAG: hypothetical protein EHM25_06850 [Nitrosopumilales archaeon]|nr:MAG: hypothetical protein EHM25_06850 [Nitrosopumilales archaeon]